MQWKFLASSGENGPTFIDGVNVWDYEWIDLSVNYSREKVIDPQYHQEHLGYKYMVKTQNKEIIFVSFEITAGVYLFFVPNE